MRALALLASLLFVGVVGAEDTVIEAPSPYGQRGVSITFNAEVGTNDLEVAASEPFYLTSVYVGGEAVDIKVSVERVFAITDQFHEETRTNMFGDVETYTQVTNRVWETVSVELVDAVATNELIAVTTPFMIKPADVIRTIVDKEVPVIHSGRR